MRYLDYSGLNYLINELKVLFVQEQEGKQLSANDFTDFLDMKLKNIEERAQENRIETIKKNGVNLSIVDKEVNIDIPKTISELVNDVDFQTRAEIVAMIREIGQMSKVVVKELPAISEAKDNTMYLILNSKQNGYKEYIVVENSWEKLGDTSHINLEDYLSKDEVGIISNEEIDLLLQG